MKELGSSLKFIVLVRQTLILSCYSFLILFLSGCNIQGSSWTMDASFHPGIPGIPVLSKELDPKWTPQWNSLVGYWKMNGPVGSPAATGDVVTATVGPNGVANNPNAVGMAYTVGQLNQAITMDGIDDSILIPNSGSFAFSSVTVSLWIYLPSATSTNRIKNGGFETGTASGWTLTNLFGNGTGVTNGAPPGGGVPATGIDGSYYLGSNDASQGEAQSDSFFLPPNIDHLSFLRAGGAPAPSGVTVKRVSDNSILCTEDTATATDVLFSDSCTGLAGFAGEKVYIDVTDLTSGGWGKTYVDKFRLQDSGNVELFSDGIIFDKSGVGDGFQIELDSNLVPNVYTPSLSNKFISAPAGLTTGVWNYLTFVYDGTTKKLFLNGSLVSSTLATGSISSPSNLYFGTGQNLYNYLNANLDEIAVWNSALTASEVQLLYSHQIGH